MIEIPMRSGTNGTRLEKAVQSPDSAAEAESDCSRCSPPIGIGDGDQLLPAEAVLFSGSIDELCQFLGANLKILHIKKLPLQHDDLWISNRTFRREVRPVAGP